MTRQKEQEELGRKAREETGEGNQMTALRFHTGEKRKRGNRKGQSNDSPEIPHRGEKEERK